jgi:hypothetical protein
MLTMFDYELKAENCAAAALASLNLDDRLEYIRMSAVWRNEALRVTLGDQAEMLWQYPVPDDQNLFV